MCLNSPVISFINFVLWLNEPYSPYEMKWWLCEINLQKEICKHFYRCLASWNQDRHLLSWYPTWVLGSLISLSSKSHLFWSLNSWFRTSEHLYFSQLPWHNYLRSCWSGTVVRRFLASSPHLTCILKSKRTAFCSVLQPLWTPRCIPLHPLRVVSPWIRLSRVPEWHGSMACLFSRAQPAMVLALTPHTSTYNTSISYVLSHR